MKTMYNRASLFATAMAMFGSALAGTLEPTAPPAPTMVTLQQIYDRQHGGDTCFDNFGANRFVECGATGFGTSNGTVKDVQTGLIWLKNANCFGATNWADANIKAATLASGQCGLTDGSQSGDWRVPTRAEWEAIIKPSCYPSPGSPALPDKLGTGCYASGTPWATNVLTNLYWTSTTYSTAEPQFAWIGDVGRGLSGFSAHKPSSSYVWPVRGGK